MKLGKWFLLGFITLIGIGFGTFSIGMIVATILIEFMDYLHSQEKKTK